MCYTRSHSSAASSFCLLFHHLPLPSSLVTNQLLIFNNLFQAENIWQFYSCLNDQIQKKNLTKSKRQNQNWSRQIIWVSISPHKWHFLIQNNILLTQSHIYQYFITYIDVRNNGNHISSSNIVTLFFWMWMLSSVI